jgi:hypothetical protein
MICSCHPGSFVSKAPIRESVPSLESIPTPTARNPAGGLSLDQLETLRSLERVDDYPLYKMRYIGDYHMGEVKRRIDQDDVEGQIFSMPNNWACSLFAALGDLGTGVYGRNFDWQFSPA